MDVKRALLAASAVSASALALAAPAMARTVYNPQGPYNPYATGYAGSGGTCIYTYKAPPADGSSAPGSSAAGGSPGYVSNNSNGPGC